MRVLAALLYLATATFPQEQEIAPTVYLASKSAGDSWTAMRDQSMEMAKDFSRYCHYIQITSDPHSFDYRVVLNHIESGLLVRDNQMVVEDMFGNMLSSKQEGSIRGGVKGACALILADWKGGQSSTRGRILAGINGTFQKAGVLGYAEIASDRLIVHSERASEMRLHMSLSSQSFVSMLRRARIATYVYTNDAGQNFAYDVNSARVTLSTALESAGH